jgi:hypothetical protein
MDPMLIAMLCRVVELSAPHLVELAQHLIERKIDPETLDWSQLYGSSIDELRARVDAQVRPKEGERT